MVPVDRLVQVVPAVPAAALVVPVAVPPVAQALAAPVLRLVRVALVPAAALGVLAVAVAVVASRVPVAVPPVAAEAHLRVVARTAVADVAQQPVRSVARAVRLERVASPSAPSAKSSTTCRPRRLLVCRFRPVTVRRFVYPVAIRSQTSPTRSV